MGSSTAAGRVSRRLRAGTPALALAVRVATKLGAVPPRPCPTSIQIMTVKVTEVRLSPAIPLLRRSAPLGRLRPLFRTVSPPLLTLVTGTTARPPRRTSPRSGDERASCAPLALQCTVLSHMRGSAAGSGPTPWPALPLPSPSEANGLPTFASLRSLPSFVPSSHRSRGSPPLVRLVV